MKPGVNALVSAAKSRAELTDIARDLPSLAKDFKNGNVSPKVKRTLIMAIAGAVYLISPIDVLPEALLGPIGLLDDAVVAAWSLNGVVEAVRMHRAAIQARPADVQDVLTKPKG